MSPRYGTPDQLVSMLASHAGLLDDEPQESFNDPEVRAEAARLADILLCKIRPDVSQDSYALWLAGVGDMIRTAPAGTFLNGAVRGAAHVVRESIDRQIDRGEEE